VQRKFLINLGFLLFLNLLVKPFYILGIDAEVQERVGPEAYGMYFALFSLSILLNIFLDLGINNFNTRNIAQHNQLLEKHLSGILSVRLLLVVVYAIIAVLAAVCLQYRGKELYLLLWLVLNQALIAYILYMRSNLAGLHLFIQDSLVSVLDRTVLIGIMAYVLWVGNAKPLSIETFVYAQSVAYGVTGVVVTYLVLRKAAWGGIRFDPAFALMIIKRSMPFALLILLMNLYYRSDSIMLERMLPDGKFQAGVYAQGFRFLDAFNMIGFLFAGLLLPIFSRMLKDKEDVSEILWLAFRLMVGGAITIAVLATFHGQEIMDLRYSEYTDLSGPAYTLLMWSFVAMALNYVFGTLLTAKGDLKFLNKVSAGGMVLNICLNLVAIPAWKAYGAAFTSMVTQVLVALVQMTYFLRSSGVKFPMPLLVRNVMFLVGGLLISRFIRFEELSNGWYLLSLLGMLVAWAIISGMVDLRGMSRIIIARQRIE
jgi:O-antigen/teichoic acid export membrane protein